MPRFALPVLLLLLLVGAVVLLSSRAREVPVTTIEADVGQAPNAR